MPHLVSCRALRAIVSPSVKSLFVHAGLGFFLESCTVLEFLACMVVFFYFLLHIIHFLFIMRGRHIVFTEKLSLINLSNYPTAKGGER